MSYTFSSTSPETTGEAYNVNNRIFDLPASPQTYSWFFWFRTPTVGSKSAWVSFADNSDVNDYQRLFSSSGGAPRWGVRSGGTEVAIEYPTDYTADTWHCITACNTDTNDRDLYLDDGAAENGTTSTSHTGIDRHSIGHLLDNNPPTGAGADSDLAYMYMWNHNVEAFKTTLAEGFHPEFIPYKPISAYEMDGDTIEDPLYSRANPTFDMAQYTSLPTASDNPPICFPCEGQVYEIDGAGGTTHEEAVALGLGISASPANTADRAAALTLAIDVATSPASTADQSAAFSLALSAGTSPASSADRAAAVALAINVATDVAAIQTAETALSLGIASGLAAAAGLNFETALSLGLSLGLSDAADITVEGALALGVGIGIADAAVAEFAGDIAIGVVQGLASTVVADLEAAATLGSILGQTYTGGTIFEAGIAVDFAITVGANGEGTLVVSVLRDGRTLTIRAADRTIAIELADRTLIL